MATQLPPVEVAYLPENPTVFHYLSMPKDGPHARLVQDVAALDFLFEFFDAADPRLPPDARAGAAVIIALLRDDLARCAEELEASTALVEIPLAAFKKEG